MRMLSQAAARRNITLVIARSRPGAARSMRVHERFFASHGERAAVSRMTPRPDHRPRPDGAARRAAAPCARLQIAAIVTEDRADRRSLQSRDLRDVDVAIDFSLPAAVQAEPGDAGRARLNVVIGTTGWQDDEADVPGHRRAGRHRRARVGEFLARHARLSSRSSRRPRGGSRRMRDVGAWIHEAHHAAKKDAPSGTALMLKDAMEKAGYTRPIDMSSTRAGSIPGTHKVGFDAPAETVTLTHTVRDRAVFAHGALEAAKWLKGRRGWFTMR